MHRFTPAEFSRLTESGSAPADAVVWRAEAGGVEPAGNGRIVRYRISDSSVARDGHTIATAGWVLDNYLRNPVFLWAHDGSQPPVGRVVELGPVGDRLMANVEYPERDVYPFADTVYQLVRGGYLNATSVQWLPLEWSFSADRERPGGIDFKRQELLEVSQVPVPALPSALVAARAAGIDTQPLYDWAERILDGYMIALPRAELETLRRAAKMPSSRPRAADSSEWKVGASRDLPIDDSDAWDGPAAASRMLDAAGFSGDSPDPAKARGGFLVYDATKPEERGSYKEPFADIVGGELKAVTGGIRAAASRLPQTDIPDDVRDAARAVLDHYEERLKDAAGDARAFAAKIRGMVRGIQGATIAAPGAQQRGLWMCAWLLMLLDDLYGLVEAAHAEAGIEGDDSPVPAMLGAAADQVAKAAQAMVAEEIGEEQQPGGDGDVDVVDIGRMLAAPAGERRTMLKTVAATLWGRSLAGSHQRSGRVLSAENERCLREAHGHLTRGCDMVSGLLDLVDDDGEGDPDDPEQRALRQRRARALQRKLAAAPAA